MGFRLGPWRTHSSESTCCCMLLVLLLALQACSRSTALSAAAYKKQDNAALQELQHLLLPAAQQRLSRRLAAAHQNTLAGKAAQAAASIAHLRSRRQLQQSTTEAVESEAPEVVGGLQSWRSSSRLRAEQSKQQLGSSGSTSGSSRQASKIWSLINGASSTGTSSDGQAGALNSFGAPVALPMDITALPEAAAGAASPNAAGVNATRNPWYDQHVLSGPANSPQGLLYQRLNTSSSSPLNTDDAADNVIGSEGDPEDSVVPDPPAYEYPPVGRYPTVFFTAVLQGYNHPSGLGPAEQAAFSAAVNAFLAPSPDIIVSNTSVITQAIAGSGLWLPCSTSLLAGDTSLRSFLASTLQGDPNLVFPTATWGSVRTTNIKEAMPTTLATVAYNWKVGDYGDCSKLCGGGVQTRRVQCLDNYGNEADTSSCPPPAPARERACQTQPCQTSLPTNFTLQLGEWGPCNSTCGFSSRTRSAMCVSKEGYLASLSSCYAAPGDLWQDLWQPCVQPPCPTYTWSYSDWVCNNTLGCGGGVANRTATCVQAGIKKTVANSYCDPDTYDNSMQRCAQNPCHVYYWRTRELGDCLPEDPSKPCGRYVQRRRFDCVNMTSNAVVPHIWCSGPKPDLGDMECTGPEDCTAANVPPTPITEDTPLGGGTSTSSNAAAGPPSVADISSVASQANAAAGNTGSSNADGISNTNNSGGVATDTGAGSAAAAAAAAPDSAKPAAPNSNEWTAHTAQASSGGNALPAALGGAGGSSANTASSAGASGMATNALNGAGATAVGVVNSNSGGSLPTNAAPAVNGGNAPPPPSPRPQGAVLVAPAVTAVPVPTAAAAFANSSWDVLMQELGPGQGLPDWLLKDPTPLLKSLMDCPSSYAVSVDGKCCGGSQLDSKGICCDGGIVDACGVCNGTGKAIDALGACCTGALDAQGVCCTSIIDECGVCNGKNACDLRADLVATLPSAALYLIPNSNANRRLRAAIQDAVAVSIAAASGRPFDKMRLSVVLSGYSPPGTQSAAAANASTPVQANAVLPVKSSGFFPQQLDADSGWQPATKSSSDGSDASGPIVSTKVADMSAAAPVSLTAGHVTASNNIVQPVQGQQPVQLDTLPAEEQQQSLGLPVLQASMLQVANRSAGSGSSSSNLFAVEGMAAHILAASMGGIKQLVNGVAGNSNTTNRLPGSGQASRSSGNAAMTVPVTSSNSVMIGVVMHSGATATGPDTGIVLLAMHRMVDTPVPVPGSSSKLTVREVSSVVRSGTCGDGICQVNERPSWSNPNSCQADCALPFLSCPAVNGSQAPCNSRGVCFNSLGSCSCTTGYTGADCSSCALNYKSINGFCVAVHLLAPQRSLSSNLTTSNSLLAQLSKHRSMTGGQAAVTVVMVGSMLVVAGAAWVVWKRRTRYLMQEYEEQLKNQVESYYAP